MEEIAEALPATFAALESGIEKQLHLGAQLCIWHDGDLIVNGGVGTTDGTVPMGSDTLLLWMSAGKPVGAVAAKLLEHDGLLDLDAPVADYWPEFAANGKETITTRHILTHTAGILSAESTFTSLDLSEVLSVLEKCSIEPDWVPGKRAAYHPLSGWQVLGELVRRTSSSPYDEFVKERVFAPLGMKSSTFRMSPALAQELGDGLSPTYASTSQGFKLHPQSTPEYMSGFVRPGGGLRSTASEMVLLYRMLLEMGELEGTKLLEPNDAAEIVSPQRVGMVDETFGFVMDWGLGIMFDNKIHGPAAPYGYGAHASQRTFGHGGRQSSTAFADPEHNLVVALVFNGMPGEPAHDRRLKKIATAIYEDLRLN